MGREGKGGKGRKRCQKRGKKRTEEREREGKTKNSCERERDLDNSTGAGRSGLQDYQAATARRAGTLYRRRQPQPARDWLGGPPAGCNSPGRDGAIGPPCPPVHSPKEIKNHNGFCVAVIHG